MESGDGLVDDETREANLESEVAGAAAEAALPEIRAQEYSNQTMRANNVRERLRAKHSKQVAQDIETVHELSAKEADVGECSIITSYDEKSSPTSYDGRGIFLGSFLICRDAGAAEGNGQLK